MKRMIENQTIGAVHCPICTHTVPAEIQVTGSRMRKSVRVAPGQRCQRCGASLNVAVIVQVPEAA
jgi:hypothetical protein